MQEIHEHVHDISPCTAMCNLSTPVSWGGMRPVRRSAVQRAVRDVQTVLQSSVITSLPKTSRVSFYINHFMIQGAGRDFLLLWC